LRVVFAGTPAFAVPALDALVSAGHEVALVLTQPDRPAGRGMKFAPSPVAACAARHGLRVSKPQSLRTAEPVAELRDVAPDAMVVAAYGLILPQAVLDIPALGCINIHASLLPRWRGAAPIHRAILAGDTETGISIMRMEAGLDTGPVLLERRLPIAPDDTTGSLTGKLSLLGAEAICAALDKLGVLEARPQDPGGVTYAAKVSKAEAAMDWTRTALELERQVRAFNPTPGAEALVEGVPLKVWQARALPDRHPAGRALIGASSVVVGCGTGSLELVVVQRSGGRRMPVEEFLRGALWSDATGIHPSH
jgi:methionyl-tRNA formyltransferase